MDLKRYFDRIGLPAAPLLTPAGLASLQQAHRFTIGFENLAIQLGEGIAIDSASVFEKLVARGRGGYCFEQNRLFSDVLSALGIDNRPLLARVRLGVAPEAVPPRTHVCLLVTLEGQHWLADAGFGGSNLCPLPLEHGAQAATPDGTLHRLLRVSPAGTLEGEWRLERAGAPSATDGRAADHLDWQAQYTFDLAQVAADDLEQANHWTATRPGTRFTTLHVVSIPLPDGFASLSDRELTISRPSGVTRRTIIDAMDYSRTLRETFRITLSEDEAARLPLFA
jgi:N-hydroxyarylamine O-acetyltransferase